VPANPDWIPNYMRSYDIELITIEIDYIIKRTIDHYKGEKFRLNSENEKLREDLDALEQYDRRELMCINGIID
jgi:hypothetical protein